MGWSSTATCRSWSDNFEKAIGLARFAETQGHLSSRVQLIRKQSSTAGGDCFYRLELNSEAVRKKLKLVTSNPQLDEVFKVHAGCVGS